MSSTDELLALDVLGLLDQAELAQLEADPHATLEARAQLEEIASLLALAVEPINPAPSLRERLLGELGGPLRLAPFVDRVAALFDLASDRVRSIFELFDTQAGWTPIYPGAAFYDLEGGPALGEATAGLVRIATGLPFPHHRHVGEERLLVLQGAFVDDSGNRVVPGQLVVMPDGSEHGFTVVSEQELLYAVVVGEVEFSDGSRVP
jgi:quercetin dioxygenase-like cupin family protein